MSFLTFRSTSPVSGTIKTRVGLLNPAFIYRNAASTDIRQTFDRIRAQQAGQAGK